jgi:hypothetical protein
MDPLAYLFLSRVVWRRGNLCEYMTRTRAGYAHTWQVSHVSYGSFSVLHHGVDLLNWSSQLEKLRFRHDLALLSPDRGVEVPNLNTRLGALRSTPGHGVELVHLNMHVGGVKHVHRQVVSTPQRVDMGRCDVYP